MWWSHELCFNEGIFAVLMQNTKCIKLYIGSIYRDGICFSYIVKILACLYCQYWKTNIVQANLYWFNHYWVNIVTNIAPIYACPRFSYIVPILANQYSANIDKSILVWHCKQYWVNIVTNIAPIYACPRFSYILPILAADILPILACHYWFVNVGTILACQYWHNIGKPWTSVYWVNIGYNIDPILLTMLDQYCTNVAGYKGCV